MTILNLVKKEFLSTSFLQPRLILAFVLSIAYTTFNPNFYPLSYYMLIFLFVLQNFYYDELNKCDYLNHSLPINQKDYAISKYTHATICSFLISIMLAIVSYFSILLGKTPLLPIKSMFLLSLSISFFMLACLLPIILKFGYKNMYIAIIFITLGSAFGLQELIQSINLTFLISSATPFLLLAISICAFLLSLFLSTIICSKKELLN